VHFFAVAFGFADELAAGFRLFQAFQKFGRRREVRKQATSRNSAPEADKIKVVAFVVHHPIVPESGGGGNDASGKGLYLSNLKS